MAKKGLTPEQQNEIKMLLANNEMLEKTKNEAEKRGNTSSAKQIERAQDEVIEHIRMIDPSYDVKSVRKVARQESLFGDTDMSMFEAVTGNAAATSYNDEAADNKKQEEVSVEEDIVPSDTTVVTDTTFSNTEGNPQYDVIQLPSNGQCYKSKLDRVPVAYLTAYDENIITSPNLYKDGIVIDYLLKSKVVNNEIDVEELVSGDVDAIVLFLRATSYGPEFPIVVTDPETGEQIESVVDLTTLKPKEFKLVGDENGHFEFVTPLRKDVIKFRYLTRKQERQLRQLTELEGHGTKASMLDSEKDTLTLAMMNDKQLSDADRKAITAALKSIERWSESLKKVNSSEITRMVTNSMQLQIAAVNGNYDRDFIRNYVNTMPTRDAMMLRTYMSENKPGIDFEIEVERPESLGGGSFKTFLDWDDSVFLNIPDVREES